jgi:hypothetical protein|tara:strand:+ start:450 stop:743 length:294 start_codon:yes stop_codon:yes gene_type:complete
MDKRFIPLKSWLLFELIVTIGALIWTIYAITGLPSYSSSSITQMEAYFFFGVILLVLRVFFLFNAWWSFYDGLWKTVKATDDGAPGDSTPTDKSSEG